MPEDNPLKDLSLIYEDFHRSFIMKNINLKAKEYTIFINENSRYNIAIKRRKGNKGKEGDRKNEKENRR